MNVDLLRDELVSTLGNNIMCLVHTGSRARGEAKPDSDYDFTLIVREIDRGVLNDIRDALSAFTSISVYILDENDLMYFPRAMNLQFVHSKTLYGECDFPTPDAKDIDRYVNRVRRDEIDILRHYLTLPHEGVKLVGRGALSLKQAYICLTYLVYRETGVLPKTRLETINYIEKKASHGLGTKLLRIYENWSTEEGSISNNPHELLHMLEKFWRTLTPCNFSTK